MSTSKYILNFDELASDLIPELRSLSKNVRREPVTLNDNIRNKLQELLDKIPNNLCLEDTTRDINKILTFLQKIDELKGDFHVDGEFKNIPAIETDYELVFNYSSNIYLTGVVFSLSAWKEEDRWSLKVGDKTIFDKITTKEVGDKKFFNIPYYVDGNEQIKVIFHNNSGNSRQVWSDLEYIKSLYADTVLIKCVDKNANLIRMYNVAVIQGTLQTVNAPSIPHYYLVTSPNYVEKVFTENNNIVTFEYNKNAVVHVKCIDKNTGIILNQYDVEVNPSLTETISALPISGYRNVETSSVSKIFTDGESIEFKYAKSIFVNIRCLEEYGGVLKTITQSLVEGETVTINAPTIEGYYAIPPNPITGVFAEGDVIDFKYSHPWGIKVVMDWEENSSADIDLYGFYGSTKVYYGHTVESNKMWLDIDNTNHVGNINPEVLTCDFDTGKLKIGVNNYNGIPLSKPITVTIKKQDSVTHTESIITTIRLSIPTSNHVYAVCEIDLDTKTVIELPHTTILN